MVCWIGIDWTTVPPWAVFTSVGTTDGTWTGDEEDSVTFGDDTGINETDVGPGMTVLLLAVSLTVRGKRDARTEKPMIRILPMTSFETRWNQPDFQPTRWQMSGLKYQEELHRRLVEVA
jgi:hypothetical protein